MPRGAASWYVYILECRDGTFYTGITTDPLRRLAEHNRGASGARYTRARRPVRLVYQEPAASRSAASRREHVLRRLRRADKRVLAAADPGRGRPCRSRRAG
jgi:putative endonuclease